MYDKKVSITNFVNLLLFLDFNLFKQSTIRFIQTN